MSEGKTSIIEMLRHRLGILPTFNIVTSMSISFYLKTNLFSQLYDGGSKNRFQKVEKVQPSDYLMYKGLGLHTQTVHTQELLGGTQLANCHYGRTDGRKKNLQRSLRAQNYSALPTSQPMDRHECSLQISARVFELVSCYYRHMDNNSGCPKFLALSVHLSFNS